MEIILGYVAKRIRRIAAGRARLLDIFLFLMVQRFFESPLEIRFTMPGLGPLAATTVRMSPKDRLNFFSAESPLKQCIENHVIARGTIISIPSIFSGPHRPLTLFNRLQAIFSNSHPAQLIKTIW